MMNVDPTTVPDLLNLLNLLPFLADLIPFFL